MLDHEQFKKLTPEQASENLANSIQHACNSILESIPDFKIAFVTYFKAHNAALLAEVKAARKENKTLRRALTIVQKISYSQQKRKPGLDLGNIINTVTEALAATEGGGGD